MTRNILLDTKKDNRREPFFLQMQEAIDNGLKDVQIMDGTLGDTIDVAIGI